MKNALVHTFGMVSCALSMIGGLIIILIYYKFPELKTFGNKMIMYVGISNVIYSFQTFFEFLFDINELYENYDLNTLCMI